MKKMMAVLLGAFIASVSVGALAADAPAPATQGVEKKSDKEAEKSVKKAKKHHKAAKPAAKASATK